MKKIVAATLALGLAGCVSQNLSPESQRHIPAGRDEVVTYHLTKYEGFWAQVAQYKSDRRMVEIWEDDKDMNERARLRATDFDGAGPRGFEIAPMPFTRIPENHRFQSYTPETMHYIYSTLIAQ